MAQKKVKKIGTIVLEYNLHIQELDAPDNILTEMNMSEGGTHIIWTKAILTPYITLYSGEHGWISQTNKDAIMALYNVLESTITITYTDNTTESVRFAHEKGISFNPTYEGSDDYTATINLAKVI